MVPELTTFPYVAGIQTKLAEAGYVAYPSEKFASIDAQLIAHALDSTMHVDLAGLTKEGASPYEAQAIALALNDMAKLGGANEKVASAKEGIAITMLEKIASFGPHQFSKFASKEAGSPADNNVVAGHKPGSVAAGESNAKTTDLGKELSNAVSNTAERPSVFHSHPGVQADEGKGTSGSEHPHPGADAQGPVAKDLGKELSNAVPNTAERPNVHGAPGHQADEDKGKSGVEKMASLKDAIARLSRV